MQQTLCPYCGQPLGADRSREHVLPRALGGNTLDAGPNPLKVPAHRTCNSRMGGEVDNRVSLGWIGLMARHHMALTFTEPNQRTPIPLGPGAPACSTWQGQQVDLWLAAPGWYWYHVHEPWKVAGHGRTWAKLPSGSSQNGGVAFLACSTNADRSGFLHPEWASTAAASGREHFLGADLHFLNALGATSEGFTPVPDSRTALRDHLLALAQGLDHKGRLPSLDIEGARSFVAKVALGLGAGLAGDAFLASPPAKRLQAVLAAKTYEEIDALVPTMRGFGHGTDLLGKVLFAPESAHTFSVIAHGEQMMLAFSLWANPWFTAFVELGEAATWPAQWRKGAVVLVDLRHREVLGPLTSDEYMVWLAKGRHRQLDASGLARAALPSFQSAE